MKNHYRRIYDREKFLGPLNDLTDNMCHKFQCDLWPFECPSHFEAPLAHQHIWSSNGRCKQCAFLMSVWEVKKKKMLSVVLIYFNIISIAIV